METVHQAFAATAAAHPDKAFLSVPGEGGRWRDLTFGEVARRVAAAQAHYRGAGYGAGHRIALLLGQDPGFVVHFLAMNGLGCTVVPVNADYRHEELSYLLGHSDADLAIALPERVPEFETAAATLDSPTPIIAPAQFESALPPARRAPPGPPPGPQAYASILYTSGTTGRPKGCLLSNECHLIAADWYRSMGGLLQMRPGEERFFNPTPFYHVNNLVVSLTCAILTASCAILVDRFSPNRWWADVTASGATIVHYVGVIPSMLMNQPPGPQDRAHRVRFGFGAGVEPQLHGPFERRFGFPLVEIWGMTEIPRVVGDNHEPRQVDTRACGRATDGLEAKVVDDEGHEVLPGQPGELLVRATGPAPRRGFFSGYLKDEAATAEAWRDGWFHTGDVVTRAADGMLYFVDRKKNIIRRAGENISAAEVEATILTHEAVHQVAVIPVPDEVRDEEVMACVVAMPGVPRDEATARAIFDWCFQRIAYFKAPAWIVFLDKLPLTPSQRLQRTRIFPPGVDPRTEPGVIDLRPLKKRAR